ncbi:hypothetical protein OEZ85_003487 [Tetradesmus obliquus]|uniref:4Fe-4S ferredoxin-type domain-containing protein n=1 Tax=Tetradesmus obliquus TaxID=3088 RepID=A0ABY8UBG0_TETOB|nr:hypothetical protein OEZ85_003487 [Tetradesmus obliquus]
MHLAVQAPRQLLALIDAAVAVLAAAAATAETHGSGQPPAAAAAAAAAAAPGSFLQAHAARLVLLSQLPASQLQGRLRGLAPHDATATAAQHASAAAAAAAAAGLSGIKAISVPPLRARASDIAPMAVQAALPDALLRGYAAVQLTDAAELQLAGYHWPGNEVELECLVQRAVLLHPQAPNNSGSNCDCGSSSSSSSSSGSSSGIESCGDAVLTLDAADFWPAAEEADRHRIDILELLPWLKPLMLDTGLWPVGMNNIMKWAYPLIIISLFLGPQDRESSAALTVFWAGWWPLVLLSFPITGRAWCAMCPFMLTGQVVQAAVGKDVAPVDPVPVTPPAAAAAAGAMPSRLQRGQLIASLLAAAQAKWGALQRWVPAHAAWHKWQLQKWPEADVALWGNWLLVAGFAAILCWEELDDLPHHAALSGWLLLLITAGAVGFSMVFEKRLWCRHICPIGGMNGLFSKLSCTEIRSRPGICAASQCSRHCHKGRLVTGMAAATGSMAAERHSLSTALMLSSSSSSSSSSYCTLAGPLEGSEVSIAALQLPGCPMNTYPAKHVDNKDCVMCANCLRACPSGSAQWRLRPPAADLLRDRSAAWHELTLMYVLLGAVLLHKLPELCGNLAYYEQLLLTELGLVLPRLALSLGADPNAAWLSALPVMGPAAEPVVSAAQGVTLMVGLAASWGLAGKVASLQEGVGSAGAGRAALPQRLLMLAVAAELWWLIV